MGVVREAMDRDICRQVAMKVLHVGMTSDDDLGRFVNEAQITGQLEHPSIVPVYELGSQEGGSPFYTMKRVRGRSLAEIIDEGDLSLPRLLSIFLKACDGVAFAHANRVVHRDLKPANIMVGEYGEVLVLDWGVAKLLDQTEEPVAESAAVDFANVSSVQGTAHVDVTMAGDVLGTPAYMPPEQAYGKIHEIDERSDIYSLGAILYEMLTGCSPVEGTSAQQILINVSQGKIQPPEKRTPKRLIPAELSAVAMKALAKEKNNRYADVPALSADINRYLDGRAVSAKDDSFFESLAKLLRRNRGPRRSRRRHGGLRKRQNPARSRTRQPTDRRGRGGTCGVRSSRTPQNHAGLLASLCPAGDRGRGVRAFQRGSKAHPGCQGSCHRHPLTRLRSRHAGATQEREQARS
jgi:eukaryotic-like serine/threonine-protein kinase